MTTLDPAVALSTCETALRELMAYSFGEAFGSNWLNMVTTDQQRQVWQERAAEEAATRTSRGAFQVPNVGLAYANFYDLLAIADRHWEPLAGALGKKAETHSLMKRFERLRNTVGHSRPLLAFERDLLSGIAGQIRNQVTLFMSKQDPSGEIYPRIESVTDSFGHRLESATVTGEIAGAYTTYDTILHPGDVVSFSCFGTDPHDRPLHWHSEGGDVVSESGQEAIIRWTVLEADVRETYSFSIYMSTASSPFHRFAGFDHRVYFNYIVRPPGL